MHAEGVRVLRRARGDRRCPSFTVVFPERRSGFERRIQAMSPPAALVHQALAALRDAPLALLGMLVTLNIFNALDMLLTMRALSYGVPEGNPLIAAMLAVDPALAALFKVVVIGAVSLMVWRLHRYRVVLEAGILVSGIYGLIMVYHAYGIMLTS